MLPHRRGRPPRPVLPNTWCSSRLVEGCELGAMVSSRRALGHHPLCGAEGEALSGVPLRGGHPLPGADICESYPDFRFRGVGATHAPGGRRRKEAVLALSSGFLEISTRVERLRQEGLPGLPAAASQAQRPTAGVVAWSPAMPPRPPSPKFCWSGWRRAAACRPALLMPTRDLPVAPTFS